MATADDWYRRLCAIVTFAAACSSATAQPSPESSWSQERGVATAARLIEACLPPEQMGIPPKTSPFTCIDAAFAVCERENGRASQRELNECASYSLQAWRQRHAAQVTRIEAVFGAWRSQARPHWGAAIAEKFRRLEADWLRWSEADCELSNIESVGGSIHNLNVARCTTQHVAVRAIELTRRAEWLETR